MSHCNEDSSLDPPRGHRVTFKQTLVETLRTGATLADIRVVEDAFVVFGAVRVGDDELNLDGGHFHVIPLR